MGKPNPVYRENPDRAVYVQGPIDETMVVRLTPEINRLRLSSTAPITLYINSFGGNTIAAETIWKLITAPNPDGSRCSLVTAVTGTAASAAADLLALGDMLSLIRTQGFFITEAALPSKRR